MAQKIFGIDLGTTNSCLAVMEAGGPRVIDIDARALNQLERQVMRDGTLIHRVQKNIQHRMPGQPAAQSRRHQRRPAVQIRTRPLRRRRLAPQL